MKNKETLKAAMDRRLSFLDDTPSCRPALMRRIVQEEEPVMKKKWSVGLVCALLILSLSVMAVAAGLILSPRVSATRMADQALEKTYGITDQLQTFFGREEKELPDGALEVTYTGAGTLAAPLGTYTAVVRNGQAEVTWSYDGKDTAGGYEAEAWGLEQLKQMRTDSRKNPGQEAYLNRAEELYEKYGFAAKEAALAEAAEASAESPEEFAARRESEKSGAMNVRKLSEEEMIGIAREFIIETYGLTDEQVSLLELYTNSSPAEGNRWYESVNGKPCFEVEYLLDENPTAVEETGYKMNAYFKVFINVETGAVEQYEYNSGVGGQG